MSLPYKGELIKRARELRKSMTPQERRLWYLCLATYPVRFQRQKVIGSFIADFYCAKAFLVIEVDGSPHFSDHGVGYDAERDILFKMKSLEVVRFDNNSIDYSFDSVRTAIDEAVKRRMKQFHKNC